MRRFTLIITAAIFAAVSGAMAESGKTPIAGDPVPPLTLPVYGGEPMTLASLKGQGVILNFWATWCVPCREEMPALNALYEKNRERGITVIGINYQQEEKTVAAFLEKTPVAFPILMDVDGVTADLFRITALPTTYLVNREGIIVNHHVGVLTEETLAAWVESLAKD